jgi:hypothetical protein
MKRYAFGLLFVLVAHLATAPRCHAVYDIVRLTQNNYDDGYPSVGLPDEFGYELNDEGTWVWQGFDGQDWEIFVSSGRTQNPPPFTNHPYNDQKPDINNDGVLVWQRGSSSTKAEIMLDTGSGAINISNSPDEDDGNPRIGDGGHVVWEGDDNLDFDVFLYNGSVTANLSNDPHNDDHGPRVNAYGSVVWVKSDALDRKEIFFSDGGMPINLSNTSDRNDIDPQINDSDWIVWSGHDGNDYEIFLWDGLTPVASHITQITNNTVDDSRPRINNDGMVVWYASDGSDPEIYCWDGVQISQITNNTRDDRDPNINKAAEVVWRSFVSSAWQIFLWDGEWPVAAHTTQITTDTNWGKGPPKINDNPARLQNDILWKGKEVSVGVDLEIFLAISCTDEDGDGYCTDAEPGGDDCDDDPMNDPAACDTCSCGARECSGCARCIHPGVAEICDGIDNNCALGIDEEPVASVSCLDVYYCNGLEYCSGGACQPGTPMNCDDGVDCTLDSCDEATDSCDHAPDDARCSDDLWCNGAERCDPLAGCGVGTPPDCRDGAGCTLDTCNEATDSCDHAPDDALCDDSLRCNGAETCDPVLDCLAGTPVDCTDGNDCTNDVCSETGDLCQSLCGAADSQDPCCSDPACQGAAVCAPPDCFIATAAFGTALEGKIEVLRSFRDAYLLNSSVGRALVQAYVQHSPPVARAVAERQWLRTLVRALLLPVVGLVSLLI